MEGLIPLVYKTIRRNRTRRQYECLSAGAAQALNVADLYINDTNDQFEDLPSGAKVDERNGHRRHKSFHIDSSGGFSMEDNAKRKQIVRFRSHKMFSCMSGA